MVGVEVNSATCPTRRGVFVRRARVLHECITDPVGVATRAISHEETSLCQRGR